MVEQPQPHKVGRFNLLMVILGFSFLFLSCSSQQHISEPVENPTVTQEKPQMYANDDELGLSEIRLVCNDEFLRPMWIDLLKEPRLNRYLLQSKLQKEYDCSKLLRITELDLNDDGRKEYAIVFQFIGVCSPTANCPSTVYGVFENESSKMRTSAGTYDFSRRKLLFDLGSIGYEVQKTKSNGYYDLLLTNNGGNNNDTLKLYRFDGNEYSVKKCWEYDKPTGRRLAAKCTKDEDE